MWYDSRCGISVLYLFWLQRLRKIEKVQYRQSNWGVLELFREFHQDPKYREYMRKELQELAEIETLSGACRPEREKAKWETLADRTSRFFFLVIKEFTKANSIPANVSQSTTSFIWVRLIRGLRQTSRDWCSQLVEAFKNKQVSRLGMGRFFSEILVHMDNRISGRVIWNYLCSVATILLWDQSSLNLDVLLLQTALMNCRCLITSGLPLPKQYYLVELLEERQDPQKLFVRVIYNGQSTTDSGYWQGATMSLPNIPPKGCRVESQHWLQQRMPTYPKTNKEIIWDLHVHEGSKF